MHQISFLLVLGLMASPSQEKSPTPAEQYQALVKEWQNQSSDLANAKTAEERKKVSARLQTLPQRFVELAEKYPKDAVALEALIQVISFVNGTAFPAGGEGSPGERAFALLARDHVRSDKLGRVCQQVLFGFHQSNEKFLRAVLEMNPHREVQGLACLSLAEYLSNRMQRLEVLRDQDKPDMAERYRRVFGKEYMEKLERRDLAVDAKEAEALFTRAADKYRDIKIPVTYYGSGGAIGEKADAELFQIRHLAVGRVAPEIEGEDQDGKRFKLSDYRGKVVLLDIWHHT